ncbi:ABC transporter ATP-binding protein [Streptomyces sioyaensis]|uniref:ABC transporter ATP-binding protein n=1 Tax=Streptomyces sioyaensis TaxID=67364 RepID=UPI00340BC382
MTTRPDDATPDATPPAAHDPAAAPAARPRPAAPTTLAELERRAASRQGRPAYGHDALIACDRLVRVFTTDGVEVQALQGLDLLVAEGELMALVGASGSGKSTLMNILAGLDVPTAGAATVAGRDLLTMDARARLGYRRDVVGFVWQQTARNLLPYLTAQQNVMLPMQLHGGRRRAARMKAAGELLSMLALDHCRDRRPHQLSGGEQQRTAIAVALANTPSVLLADEPTGELDSHTAEQVFTAFRTANEELGTTIVIVTHDQAVAGEVRRTVAIRDGRTSSEVLRRTERDAATGRESLVAREYAMLDRAGRLQLPAEYTHSLGMEHRVLLELESDHIGVWPDRTADGTARGRETGGEGGRDGGRGSVPDESKDRGRDGDEVTEGDS